MSDRVAVLTGVTGGWGRAVLDRFAGQGWKVVATHRGDAPGDLPGDVLAVEADLTDPASAEAVVAAALDRFGRVDALANCAGGASWVSFHHGGGVGIGNSLHAGMVIVADGTDAAAKRLERVLTIDPGMGIIRHADAGYDEAIATADERGVVIPRRRRD